MHLLLRAAIAASVLLLANCAGAPDADTVHAQRLGVTVAEARAIKARKGLTDADMSLMTPEIATHQVAKVGAESFAHPLGLEQWRRKSLVDENDQIAPNAHVVAKEQMDALDTSDATTVGGLAANNWTALGPTNIGGRTRALAIHPTNPSLILAGSVAGGIWRSQNAGASWARVGDAMTNLAVTEIVFQPGNPTRAWATTGEGFSNIDAIRGAGIWLSVDSGATWGQLPSTANASFYYCNAISFSPNGATMLIGTDEGIFRSINGGLSFTKVAGSTNGSSSDVEFHPTDNLRAVAHLRDYDFALNSWTSTIATSVDGGATWTAAASPSPAYSLGYGNRIELAWNRGFTGPVGCAYAQQYLESVGTKLLRTTDGGATWAIAASNSITGSQGWYDNTIWVDPSNPDANVANDIIFCGGVDLHRSINGGATFTSISRWQSWPTSAHADHHRIVPHPQFNGTTNKTVYFANDGGIWRTDDCYAVAQLSGWVNLNSGYAVTQFYGGSRHAGTGILIGGTQDNGTLRTIGSSTTWSTTFGGDGGFCASDPTNSSYHYGEYVDAQVFRSSNGGLSGSYVYGPIAGGNFIAPFILDPNNSNTMLVGSANLWRSNDIRTAVTPSWTTIQTSPSGNPVSAIAIQRSNSAVAYVGYNNGDLFRTTNATAALPTWVQIDNGPPALPNRYITRIVVDPFNASRLFVCFGGYASDNLWVSNNGGTSWSVVPGLPAAPVRDLEIHEANPAWLYAATEVGLLVSVNSGLSWVSSATPARVSIDEMFFSSHELYLVTHGLGMYRQAPFAAAATSTAGAPCIIGGALTGPTLSSSTARIGTSWSWNASAAPTSSLALLFYSVAPAAPTQLSPGCFAQIDLATNTSLGVQVTSVLGTAAWSLSVPDNPAFCGVELMTQCAVLSGANYHLSNGIRHLIGP